MIGEKIKYQRKKVYDMTQLELSKKINVSRSSVNSWELGTSYPSLSYIIKLSRIFHVSIEYLISDYKIEDLICTDLTEEQKEILMKLCSIYGKMNTKE